MADIIEVNEDKNSLENGRNRARSRASLGVTVSMKCRHCGQWATHKLLDITGYKYMYRCLACGHGTQIDARESYIY